MDTSKLKKFAQEARRALLEQVSSKLSLVLQTESGARREAPQAISQLEQALKAQGKDTLIDKVAYVWFNRFCALRFMDVNGYNRLGVVSPAAGQVQPEILSEAKAGHLDDSLVSATAAERVSGLLSGSIKSQDGQTEAYRNLIVAVCNSYHSLMPYLFQHIDDYTELLMPDDLLSENSILAKTREAMTADACASVEVIGWLYQFYISEKKDKVFADLKNNKKVTAENIPAATQLFTPHWIVRYLVENSLGRLWLLNNPNSRIVEKMDYYIKPEEAETDFLKITSPEELKVCDPAAGSGHMLTYAYDLLYAIYLDAGYDPVDIPELILTKNLYGIEIDERASELAAFALSMKAIKGNPEDDGNNRRRFFRNPIKPNICKLEKIVFNEHDLDEYFEFVGKDLFTADLRKALKDFEEADNFGSLITPTIGDVTDVLRMLEAKDVSGQLFLTDTHHKVLQLLRQSDYLSQNYHVIVANPPYMGGKGMNSRLSTWVKENYPNSKSDLFAMFIERGLLLTKNRGFCALITIQNWLFINSFETLRKSILKTCHFSTLVKIGFNSFPELNSKFALASACVLEKSVKDSVGVYFDLNNSPLSADKNVVFLGKKLASNYYAVSQNSFEKIPGSPIAFWANKEIIREFSESPKLESVAFTRKGMVTARNHEYVRSWSEVSISKSGLDKYHSRDEAKISKRKWFSYLKGGGFRKWYGNKNDVVNWENDGEVLQSTPHPTEDRVWATNFNLDYIFRPNVNWGAVSLEFSSRISTGGELFDAGGSACFPQKMDERIILGFLNSKISRYILKILNPSLNIQAGNISDLPVKLNLPERLANVVDQLIEVHRVDWDSSEASWDFRSLPILSLKHRQSTLKSTYRELNNYWKNVTLEMMRLEEEVNTILIAAYGLRDVITPEVPIEEITLNNNSTYLYGINITEEERESRLRTDTVVGFLSYAVGCMFGRYSLDEPGLILANQGERLEDYLARIPAPTFMPDDDNVIPLIDFDGDWFEDDITERFKKFLKVTFGEANFADNLAFIEDALGKDIRKYFLKDFYKDHVQRYKKRPIYWQFSSSKGTFNALIYMHRYRPDTCSLVLEYLRDFRVKLEARKQSHEQISISASASQKDKTHALKMIDKINKALDEVSDYEREVLFPLAAERISIDLDDGVKRNYPLFGNALKKIAGLEGDDND